MAPKSVSIADLPLNVLRHILLTAVNTDNLLRYVTACASVCAEWRRVVGESAAFGKGLAGEERARVLKKVADALDRQGTLGAQAGSLTLGRDLVGDVGAAALGVALLVTTPPVVTDLSLFGNRLTAAGAASLVPALRRMRAPGNLRHLSVGSNPDLGDAGVSAFARALPASLETLSFTNTGCGDGGFVAMAAALPALTRLRTLYCYGNALPGARGWAHLAAALPSLPALELLSCNSCTGMGVEGARKPPR